MEKTTTPFTAALDAERSNLLDTYLVTLRRAKELIDRAITKAESGHTTHHDGFNLGGIASDIEMVAGKLDLLATIALTARTL
jgi:hypothetical protein